MMKLTHDDFWHALIGAAYIDAEVPGSKQVEGFLDRWAIEDSGGIYIPTEERGNYNLGVIIWNNIQERVKIGISLEPMERRVMIAPTSYFYLPEAWVLQ